MTQKKSHNPNTYYGRKKLRIEHYKKMAKMPVSERKEVENNSALIFVLLLIVFGSIIYLIFGGEGLIRWLGGKAPD